MSKLSNERLLDLAFAGQDEREEAFQPIVWKCSDEGARLVKRATENFPQHNWFPAREGGLAAAVAKTDSGFVYLMEYGPKGKFCTTKACRLNTYTGEYVPTGGK